MRLTRDPDTLSRVLEKSSGSASALANWADHMAIAHSGRSQSVMGGSRVPPFPSLERRLAVLGRLGATLTRAPARMPLKTWLFAVPLLAIAGWLMLSVLPLMAFVSVALSMLLTGLPVGALHALLRWIGS